MITVCNVKRGVLAPESVSQNKTKHGILGYCNENGYCYKCRLAFLSARKEAPCNKLLKKLITV